KGLGPTIDISPLNIFTNSGNSSKEVCLKKLPNLVSRFESCKSSPFSSFSLVIVLNLYIVKICSFLPGLFCLNIAGLPSFFLTRRKTIINIGPNKIKANNDNTISNKRFIYFLYILQSLPFILKQGFYCFNSFT